MKRVFAFLVLLFSLAACGGSADTENSEEESKHPLIGKWQLAQVNDSTVIDNPYVIGMEFTEDGEIVQRDGADIYKAKYMISDDTTTISVLEGGKVVEEFKVRSLNSDYLIIEEGFDEIRFIKVD